MLFEQQIIGELQYLMLKKIHRLVLRVCTQFVIIPVMQYYRVNSRDATIQLALGSINT